MPTKSAECCDKATHFIDQFRKTQNAQFFHSNSEANMGPKYFCIFILLMFSGSAFAEDHSVEQKNKAFIPKTMSIKVGDTVDFLNSDPFIHNVFSLSDVQMFDLGSYPQGESKKIVFETPGDVEVECAIHQNMLMTITVTP